MLNQSLISPAQTYVAYGQFTYTMNDNSQLYGELIGSRRDSSQVGYRQLSLDYAYFPGQAAGNGGLAGGALNNNPLLPTNLQFTTYAGVRQDPDITHGLPIGVRAFIGFGNDRSEQRADAGKATIGWRGDFKPLANWRFDVTGSYQDSSSDYTFGSFIQSHLNQSLDVVPLPTGSSAPSVLGTNGVLQTCRVNTTGSSNCIPAPVLSSSLIGGNLPQNFRDWIFKPVTGTTQYSEAVLTANFDGPVAKLPGGDLQLAVGAEYRHDKLNDQPPPESVARDLFNFTSAVPSVGTDSVWEVYGEAEAPLLRDLPFVHSLTVNVSGRYTKYKEYSGDSTYKVGAKYEPFSWLTFRGTYGTSYRAPAVFEAHQGATSGFQSATQDVCSNYGTKNPASNLYKNCDADLHNTSFISTTGITVNTIGGKTLTPETSTNYGFGFIAQPKLGDYWGKLQLAVDYYNIDVSDEISQYSFTTYLSNCYNSQLFRSVSGFCDSVVRNAAGQLTVNSGYVNIAKQVVRGIDYNARYLRDLGPGNVRLNLLVTRYLEQSSKSTPTAPLLDENGTIFQPKYTATFDATYSWSNWKVRYGLDWTRKMNSYDDIFGPGANFENTGYVFSTPDYYVHNLSMEYQAKQNFDIIVGVRDLFDSKLPSISSEVYNRIGTVPLYSGYNFLGRTVFVNVSKKF